MMGSGDSEKDQLAHAVVDLHADFEAALVANRRKYPVSELRLFAEAIRNYVDKTRNDDMFHRAVPVVGAVNGSVNELAGERKRVPGDVLFEAGRLECLVFAGYDPHFEANVWRMGWPARRMLPEGSTLAALVYTVGKFEKVVPGPETAAIAEAATGWLSAQSGE
jgi:hypothetical protein